MKFFSKTRYAKFESSMRKNMQNRKTYFFGWKRNDLSIVTPRFPVISHSAVPRLHVAWISSRSKHSFLHRVFHFRLGALHVNIFLISVNSRRRCNLSLAICLPSDRSRIRFSSFSSSMNSFFYIYIFSCFSLLLALFQCKSFKVSSLSINQSIFLFTVYQLFNLIILTF